MVHSDGISPPKRRIGVAAYVIAGLSFIPLLGIIFGLVGLVWAALSKYSGRLIVAIVSLCGIGFTVGIYGWLFYQAQNPNGPFAPLKIELAKQLLIEDVKAIELYKLQRGSYPDSLAEVGHASLNGGFPFSVTDPSGPTNGSMRDFYYARIGENAYELRGLGPDGRPFTDDDLLPDLGSGPRGQIGLVTQAQGS